MSVSPTFGLEPSVGAGAHRAVAAVADELAAIGPKASVMIVVLPNVTVARRNLPVSPDWGK